MANALSYGMPQQENPLSPIPSAPTFGMKQPQQTGAMNAVMPSKKANALAMKSSQMAPPPMPQKQKMMQRPMTSASPNALAMAFGSQQQKPDAMYAFMDTLQRTIDPAAAQARETRMTEEQKQKLTQGLAFVQQMQALPAEQRMAFVQQGAGQFGLGQNQFDANAFTDEALAQSVATLSAQLGQGPAAAEYMNLGGGNVGMTRNGQFSMVREAPQERAKPIEVNGRLVDPETYEVIGDFSDPEKPATPPNWQTQQVGNRIVAYNPQDPKQTIDMGPAPPKGASGDGNGSGLTPNQLLTAQLKIDDLDRELADIERSRKSSLSTVTSSIALLEDFLSPENEATFNEVYGNWINPTGEGNDFLNPRVTPGSPRANGMAILEQLGGRAFLDSIQAMKGTGALSDREGAKVGAAATRLMQVTQDDAAARKAGEEFLVTLQSYKTALEQDLQATRAAEASRRQQVAAMMGVPVPPSAPAQQSPSQQNGSVALTGRQAPGIGGAQKMQARIASQSTGIPQDAILEMMQNPTPEEFAQFNEVFGEGAAERILDGQF